MLVSSLPTYSFLEVKSFIRLLGANELIILKDVFAEEVNIYPLYESRAIFRLIMLQEKRLTRNELQCEFLLGYN